MMQSICPVSAEGSLLTCIQSMLVFLGVNSLFVPSKVDIRAATSLHKSVQVDVKVRKGDQLRPTTGTKSCRQDLLSSCDGTVI